MQEDTVPRRSTKSGSRLSGFGRKGFRIVWYPVIFSQAKQEKAEIHWGYEKGLQTGANRVRGFAPKRETPVVRLVAKQSHVGTISAIPNGGKFRFMMCQETMNAKPLNSGWKNTRKKSRWHR